MKIAFAGPSGTGKTTLAMYISKRWGIPFNPVGARSVAASMGFKDANGEGLPYEVDKAGRRADFQRLLIAEKIRWETANPSFVTDRTPLDNITYTVMHDVSAIDADLLAAAVSATKSYTHVIRCAMSVFFAPGDDGARVKDATYHELYEATLDGLLSRHVSAMRLRTLECSALEARYREVATVLGLGG